MSRQKLARKLRGYTFAELVGLVQTLEERELGWLKSFLVDDGLHAAHEVLVLIFTVCAIDQIGVLNQLHMRVHQARVDMVRVALRVAYAYMVDFGHSADGFAE